MSVNLLKTAGEMHERTENENLMWELPFIGAYLLQEPDLMVWCQSSFYRGLYAATGFNP